MPVRVPLPAPIAERILRHGCVLATAGGPVAVSTSLAADDDRIRSFRACVVVVVNFLFLCGRRIKINFLLVGLIRGAPQGAAYFLLDLNLKG